MRVRERWRELSPQDRWRRWGPPGIVVIALSVALLTYANNAFNALEGDTMDTRFQIRGSTQGAPDDLIIVAIDSRSLTALDTFPFPRRFHARVIDILREDGAEQISYDIQFSEQTTVRDDNALIRAIDRTPHVVLASTETDERGRTDVLGGDEVLRLIGARVGFSALRLGARTVPRFIPRVDQNVDTFATATVEQIERRQVDPDDEPSRNPWIDYLGPPGTFRTIPFVDVLRKRTPPGTFDGTTVIVGATANNLQDVHESPWRDELMAGPEVQANAIHTVRNEWPLRSLPRGLDVLIIVVLTLVPVLLNRYLGPIAAFGIALLIAAAYIGASVPAFSAGTILPITYPVLGITATSIGFLGLAYITTAFDRQRTKDTFARFVPEAVIGQLLARSSGGLVKLSSEEVEATVLFSDIRGFTTFSESRSPEQVIDILNHYLTGMTDAILDNGGTLVAYLGDGILAVFGAPIHQDDHADRALQAAKEMLGPKLDEFNEYALSELGLDYGFAMGVGLNSGPVMAGMVGSERRLDYTTIGDTVNTASRLEGATKDIDGSILVADTTHNALIVPSTELEYVGEIDIRGREGGIGAWTIPGI